MVVGEPGQLAHREPADVGVFLATTERTARVRHQSEIGYGYGMGGGVAPRVAEGVQLFEVEVPDPGLLIQFTARRVIQGLSDLHETAGKGPVSGKWPLLDFDQQRLEHPAGDGE